VQSGARLGLPFAGTQCGHLLEDATQGGDDESPGELGGRVARKFLMLLGADQDAELVAGRQIDLGRVAAAADESELRRPAQQAVAHGDFQRRSRHRVRCALRPE